MLDPSKFFSGEFWRLFTYQFVHNSPSHLVENIAALLLSVILAIELKAFFSDYSVTYFSAGILAILPIWLISPFLALGASTAIYGSFGMLSRSAKRFNINPYLLLAVLTLLTAASSTYTYYARGDIPFRITLQQLVSHLAGLFFGYYFGLLVMTFRERYAAKRLRCLRSLA